MNFKSVAASVLAAAISMQVMMPATAQSQVVILGGSGNAVETPPDVITMNPRGAETSNQPAPNVTQLRELSTGELIERGSMTEEKANEVLSQTNAMFSSALKDSSSNQYQMLKRSHTELSGILNRIQMAKYTKTSAVFVAISGTALTAMAMTGRVGFAATSKVVGYATHVVPDNVPGVSAGTDVQLRGPKMIADPVSKLVNKGLRSVETGLGWVNKGIRGTSNGIGWIGRAVQRVTIASAVMSGASAVYIYYLQYSAIESYVPELQLAIQELEEQMAVLGVATQQR